MEKTNKFQTIKPHNDMKKLKNWRWWALFALFATGYVSAALIFGEDERPTREWIEVRVCLAAVAAASFYPMARLMNKWEREGKIKI